MSNLDLASISSQIQDPFYPDQGGIPNGPAFLDSAACLCAYRTTPVLASDDLMWTCIGNQTEGINIATQGKWFNPSQAATSDGNDTDLGPIWSASNGQDTASAALMYDQGQDQLVALDASKLNVYDAACTAVNQTTFSTAYYGALAQYQNNETMTDAALCYRGVAVPVQLATVEEWQQTGCPEGLLCMYFSLRLYSFHDSCCHWEES